MKPPSARRRSWSCCWRRASGWHTASSDSSLRPSERCGSSPSRPPDELQSLCSRSRQRHPRLRDDLGGRCPNDHATRTLGHPTMIDLHYWTTPNGHKITIALEEIGTPYRVVPVNISTG